MKIIFAIILLLVLTSLSAAQLSFEISITPKTTAIYCEPISINIMWKNISKQNLFIGPPLKPTESEAVTIYANDEPRLKLPLPTAVSGYSMEKDWLEPGESSTGSLSILSMKLNPGTYKVKAVADFNEFARMSPNHFQERLESNTVEFTLKAPYGEDLMAWQSLAGTLEVNGNITEKEMLRICSGLRKPAIIKDYPNSIYATTLIFDSIIGEYESRDPGLIRKLMKEGLYPGWNSVPDPQYPGGWRGIERGKPMAKWQNEWAQRILKNRPDFPYKERLELVVGLNHLVLGNKAEGLEKLTKIASRKETKEGKFAEQFLNISN